MSVTSSVLTSNFIEKLSVCDNDVISDILLYWQFNNILMNDTIQRKKIVSCHRTWAIKITENCETGILSEKYETERLDKIIQGARKKRAAYVYYYRDIKVKLQRLGSTRAAYCSFNFPRESFALMLMISSTIHCEKQQYRWCKRNIHYASALIGCLSSSCTYRKIHDRLLYSLYFMQYMMYSIFNNSQLIPKISTSNN